MPDVITGLQAQGSRRLAHPFPSTFPIARGKQGQRVHVGHGRDFYCHHTLLERQRGLLTLPSMCVGQGLCRR